jgi:hypothetical protein
MAQTEITLRADVVEVLRSATVAGKHLQLSGQLDRKLYLQVAAVIEALGGKWSRKAQAHVFDSDPREVVEDAIATGAVTDLRKLYQFYPTPPAVAVQLVELAVVERGMRVLEPSAGQGAIVSVLRTAGAIVDYCELHPENRTLLSQRFREGTRLVAADFLQLRLADLDDRRGYDRIVANPPFSDRQDIAHVTHMYELLAPGGKLVSVMSPRWLYGEGAAIKAFRMAVIHLGGVWIELPEGSFKPSGTNVRTGILELFKLDEKPLLDVVR